MAGALQLIARLHTAPVPPVPPCKNSGEPLEAAPLLEVPPVPPVPPQKHDIRKQCTGTDREGQWLARVARLLGCSPAYLLEHGFVDRHDLAEQHQQHPRLAARLIRTHPSWCPPGETPHAVPEHSTRTRKEACEPSEPQEVATSRSPTWIAARDAFHRHALGNCPECYPPLGRYCVTGAELQARYLRAEP